ncbi:MAG: Spy/CpxP family protein refolding chaperone [Thermoguttaceae bacterium]
MIRRAACLVMVGLLSLATWGGNSASAQAPEGGPGQGQGPRGRGPGMMFPGGGLLFLLRNESVQKDLQLTPEQIDKLKELGKTLREGLPERGAFRNLSQEERRAKFAELQPKLKARGEEIKKKIEAILTTAQLARLKEIRVQVAGPAALADTDVLKALNLTDEQKEKIKGLRQQVADLRKEAGKLSREERQQKRAEMMEKMQKLRDKVLADIVALLTPEQRAQFEKLKGKKIELKPGEFLPPVEEPGVDLPNRAPGK